MSARDKLYYCIGAFILGAALSFGLAPFNFLPICFFSFSSFIYLQHKLLKHKPTGFTIFMLGFAFGLGYFCFSLYWIFYAFLILYNNNINFALYSLLSSLALGTLFIYLALYWGMASFFASFFKKSLTSQSLAFACCLGMCEWLRSHLFTGFAWNLVGYSATTTPILMQSSALLGIYSLTSLSILVYCSPIVIWHARSYLILILSSSLIITDVAYGYLCLIKAPPLGSAAEPSYNIRLVQPSISQKEKLDPNYNVKNFYRYIDLTLKPSKTAAPDLIIWPETAINFLLNRTGGALDIIKHNLQKQQKLLLGAPRAESNQIYNSAILLNNQGQTISFSDKIHLVPFGEYTPFGKMLQKLFPNMADLFSGYAAGRQRHSVKLTQQQIYLPLICYEAIFAHEMTYTGPKATLIINLTNDAWYGPSIGPYQHFQQSRLRAVEQRLPLIRVANNGISAIIDPYGRIVRALNVNQIGIIDSPIPRSYVPIWGEEPQTQKKIWTNLLASNSVFALISAILGCLAFIC